MPELCSMQVTWLGLTPLYLAESTAVVCWLLLLSPGPPGKHQPLLDLLEVSSSVCLRGSHLRRPSIQKSRVGVGHQGKNIMGADLSSLWDLLTGSLSLWKHWTMNSQS